MSDDPGNEAVIEALVRRVRDAVERGRKLGRSGPLALVGVGGTAATGKTTLARRIVERAGIEGAVVATDGYMLERPERRRRGITGPNPAANDVERLARDLRAIAGGKPARVLERIETPEGRKSVETEFRATPLVVVEGLIALYPALDVTYDLSFFLDGPPGEELAVRLERDVKVRRHPRDEVVSVFGLRQQEYDRYLRPTAARATVRLWADRPQGAYRLRELP